MYDNAIIFIDILMYYNVLMFGLFLSIQLSLESGRCFILRVPKFVSGTLLPIRRAKKNYIGIFEYILASMLKVFLDIKKTHWDGCQV